MKSNFDYKVIKSDSITESIPEHYKRPFHAYHEGNLSWDTAFEAKRASCFVGARNFPQYGSYGKDAFCKAFNTGLKRAGANIPKDAKILDIYNNKSYSF